MGFEATNSGPRASDFWGSGVLSVSRTLQRLRRSWFRAPITLHSRSVLLGPFLRTKPVWLEGFKSLRSGFRASGFQVWDTP